MRKIAQILSKFFVKEWKDNEIDSESFFPPMIISIAGFDEKEQYGRAYEISVPHSPQPREIIDLKVPGLYFGGQTDIAERIVYGFDLNLPEILLDSFNFDKDAAVALIEELESRKFVLPIGVLRYKTRLI